MTKRLRVIAIVVFILAVFSGTVSAYDSTEEEQKVPKKINITENNGEKIFFETEAETVSEFLKEQNITLNEEESINKSLNATLESGDILNITRPISVVVNLDGVPRMITTNETTVGSMLANLSDIKNITYILENVEESAPLSNNMAVNLISTVERISKSVEEIPFETVIKESENLAYGTEKVVQQGSAGELEITTKEVFQGDKIISTEEMDRKVMKEAVNTIVEKGTAKAVTTSVGSLNYSRALNVTATGYTPFDAGCTGITATGIPAKRGIIAVDTNVIPMGSRIYIPGYGEGIAADRGGAIKGNKIDLCYETKQEAYNWGRRNVTIYILE